MRLGFLASGNGSAMCAIVTAIEEGALCAEARLAVSNKPGAPALEFARAHGIETLCIRTLPDPGAADERLAEALEGAGVEVVVLSGYLRRLAARVLGAYEGRILNIHPALLPRFGGKGLYGRAVHEAVSAAGETKTGASVHMVDEIYDHGPVLAQAEVRIAAGEDPQSIEAKVRALEPELFLSTLKAIVEGRIRLPRLEPPEGPGIISDNLS
ncbi:MAG: phosphoribosylglycinamide formyltransferase [Caulobacteraceae bacterium]